MTDKTRIVVLASGRGTNLQALLDATRNDTVAASVIAVISHTPTALALERARRAGIPAHFVAPPRKLENREEWDGYLADLIEPMAPDLILMLGWMKVLGKGFLDRFPNPHRSGEARVWNLHPALPGELPGTDAILRAWEEAEEGRRTKTGVMVHVATPTVDEGRVLCSETVEIDPGKGFEDLETRIHAAEHRLVVEAVRAFSRS
jgi:phosphoribosylglycinamide formyltransferase-1